MKDVFGYELRIGDRVAFNPPNYKGLTTGTVVAFTPKMVRVSYNGNYTYKKDVVTTVVYSFDTVKKVDVS